MRAHANFAEYVPIALLLLFFFEQQWKSTILVHIFGTVLVIARLVHAYGITQDKENLRYRVFGVASTFFVIGSLSIGIMLGYFYK